MEIKNLKDFKALVKACRILGVDAVEIGHVKIALGVAPRPSTALAIDETAFPEASIRVPAYDGPIAEPDAIPTEGLTEDQLMFYSAQGHDQVE